MIDIRHLEVWQPLGVPEFPWPANRARWCSIRFTMAVWAARNGYRYEGRWARR